MTSRHNAGRTPMQGLVRLLEAYTLGARTVGFLEGSGELVEVLTTHSLKVRGEQQASAGGSGRFRAVERMRARHRLLAPPTHLNHALTANKLQHTSFDCLACLQPVAFAATQAAASTLLSQVSPKLFCTTDCWARFA